MGGGVAAYKSCELVRRLREDGHAVQVVPTPAALEFVGRATWEALSGRPVSSSVWDDIYEVAHVYYGQSADLVLVAPATADLLARAATGQADDLLTSTLLATRAPVIFAPAMHTEMWQHPATVANVATLRARGVLVVEPAIGRLAGSDSGPGRLPEPAALAALARAALDGSDESRGRMDLAGVRVLISAGGTREPLDPVRFLGNRSSGRQGWALAAAAVARGAEVTMVAANVQLADPAGATVISVQTAEQLRRAVVERSAQADVIIMAAAVADYRPAKQADTKLKKPSGGGGFELALEQTVDVLAELGQMRGSMAVPILVGFAAETVSDDAELQRLAAAKLADKRADLIVANRVGGGRGFEASTNEVLLVTLVQGNLSGAASTVRPVASMSKEGVANAVFDEVMRLRSG